MAPRRVTERHDPPVTFIGRIVHSENTEPSSLQPSSVTSKKLQRRKSAAMNAVLRCVEALKRQLWNVHSRNTTPRVVASVRSTSEKVHSSKTTSTSSSPYQSSPR